MNFGEILRARRTFGRISLNKLSDISGFDINTLKAFESNNKKPITYEDIPNGKLSDNDIGLFNEYLKFCRLTEALRFDIYELEAKIRNN